MITEFSDHLTEDALNDALIGLSSPESEAHLATCAVCRVKVEEFRSEMQMFNQTTLAWSEARPAKSLQGAGRTKAHPVSFAAAGWVLAAVVLLMIAIPVWNRDRRSAARDRVVPASAPENSEAQIAQDNELLRQIDMALSASEASPINEYHLADRPHPRLKVRKELRNR